MTDNNFMPTGFFDAAWKKMSQIPRGRVTTYGEIARALKKPGAGRAVGNACKANPNAPQVPCHRVVASNGSLGGYAGGLRKKIGLLKKEGVLTENGKITEFKHVFWRFK